MPPLHHKFKIVIPPQDIACEPELPLKLANGDRQAFAWVYKNYCRRVYEYTLLMIGCKVQSEDIVQDVFIKLWVNKEKLRDVRDFNSYFYTLYHRHILSEFRKKKTESTDLNEYALISDPGMTPEQQMEMRETKQVLHRAVDQLPPRQRQVYELREWGMKRPEMARQLGIAPLTVKTHILKALGAIREQMKESFPTLRWLS